MSQEPREWFAPYVDDELPQPLRAQLEDALTTDPELRRDFEDYRESVAMLRGLPPEPAPDRFLLLVQNRIRRRSRGRHFSELRRPRPLVVEAAACAVLIFVMAALYLVGARTDSPSPKAGVSHRADLAPADTRLLTEYGRIETVGTSVVGDGLVVRVVLPTEREDALRRALQTHPRMSLDPTSRHQRGARVWFSVRARPGPVSGDW